MMVKQKKNETYMWIVVFVLLILLIFIVASFVLYMFKINEETTQLREEVVGSDEVVSLFKEGLNHIISASNYDKQADLIYDVARSSYERGNYLEQHTKCVEARQFFSKSAQEYRNAKAIFEQVKEKELSVEDKTKVGYHIERADAGVKMQNAIYEACENLESVANFYSQGNYEGGKLYLDKANEKINLHDHWTNIHNDYLAKIRA